MFFRYLYLLADFDKNTVELNKALVKMLHRIAFDLKNHSKLYQVCCFHWLYGFSCHCFEFYKE